MRWNVVCAVAALGLALCPPAAADFESRTAIAALNALRAANGIPAGVTENPAWSAGCERHIEYSSRNATLGHFEDPAMPGYTPEGDRAARNSVLGPPVPWIEGSAGPWAAAPIHLMQLLGPGLAETGFAPGCMYTWPGYLRPSPAAPELFSYPGDGRLGVPARETADEAPVVPGDFVGLPAGTTTGPHLYVLAWGVGDGRLTHATLAGPHGPVAVRTVDDETPGLTGYLPPGGIVIPVRPLRKRTRYTASATFEGPLDASGETAALTRTWTFRTEGRDPRPRMARTVGGRLRVVSRSRAPIYVTVVSLPGEVVVFRGTRPVPRLRAGRYRVCAHQAATRAWAPFAFCRQLR